MQIQSTKTYNVTITGKIRFWDNIVNPGVYRGVYDNGVALWFRNSNNPNDWYNPDTGHTRHESYDILDNQGNFSFNFSFTGDLSAYNQVIVIVNTANDAAFVPTPADGYIVYNADGTTTSYFNEGDGITANFDPSNTNISINQNGEFDPGYGAIFRYAMLSKEFVEQRYGGSLPFSLPAIYTRIYDLSSQGDAGVFCSSNSCTNLTKQPYGPYIMIDPNWTDFDTISHENGHDVNFRMWGKSKFDAANDDLVEGWAIFYSFAARNYGNRQYGDDLLEGYDNTEEAPFQTDPRYYSIGYADAGQPAKAAAACFLWNLYDSNHSPTFEASLYDNGDNDDLSGYSNRTFEQMRTLGTTTITGYRDSFKSGLPTDIQNSVDDDYHFMFDNLTAIPSHKMKSDQVTDFSATVHAGQNNIAFSWQPQSYPSGLYYGNYPSGYRLYRNSGSGWQLIHTISTGTTDYTYGTTSPNGTYKITSYNSQGNSDKAPTVTITPLSVTISGSGYPESVPPNSYATWTANVSGGTSPYQYQWQKNVDYQGYWGGWNNFGTTQTVGMPWSSSIVEVKLKVTVTDANNAQATSPVFTAYFSQQSAPVATSLSDPTPNPFNPTTVLNYSLAKPAHVKLMIYNILGQLVATLVDANQTAGKYRKTFDALQLSSGTYLERMIITDKSGKVTQLTKKLLLMK